MLHILLAEDNLGDVLLVQQALEQHQVQHELHVVRDGAEALNFVARMDEPGSPGCPDLMVLDLNLPKVDGAEVLSEFRKHPKCAHTPVLVVTSSDAPIDRARVAELGITRYFKKPSSFDAFMQLGGIVREIANQISPGGDRP